MNMKNWISEQIAAPTKKAMPVLSFPAIQLLDITVKELISSAEKQAEGMKLVAENTDAAASVSMMDLSVEAEAFGSEIRVSDDEVPTVIGHIIDTEEDADNLAVPDATKGRTGLYVDAIGLAVKQITDRPVFAGIIGPFSLAGRLIDVSEALICCYTEPDMVKKVMAKATQFLINYANAYKAVGAHGVVIAEPLAGLLSPDLMEEFALPYIQEIVSAVQTDDFIVVYHNCGNEVEKLAETIYKTGAAAYHFGNAVRMEYMLERAPKDALVMGNIDPAGLFRNGTPEAVHAATLELLGQCSKYDNFVISSGCDIPPLSSWDNINAFFAATKEFYNK